MQTQLLATKAFGEKIKHWNAIVVHLIIKKSHTHTGREWNRLIKDLKMSKSKNLNAFLKKIAICLIVVTLISYLLLFALKILK